MESFDKVMTKTRGGASQGDTRQRRTMLVAEEITNKLSITLVVMCCMK